MDEVELGMVMGMEISFWWREEKRKRERRGEEEGRKQKKPTENRKSKWQSPRALFHPARRCHRGRHQYYMRRLTASRPKPLNRLLQDVLLYGCYLVNGNDCDACTDDTADASQVSGSIMLDSMH